MSPDPSHPFPTVQKNNTDKLSACPSAQLHILQTCVSSRKLLKPSYLLVVVAGVPLVREQVDLGALALDVEVMRVLKGEER